MSSSTTTSQHVSATTVRIALNDKSKKEHAPVKVAFVLPELALRGSVRRSINLALDLDRRGHDVAIVSPGGPLERSLENSGLTLIPWQLSASRKSVKFLTLSQTLRRLRAFAPDILHVNTLRWFTPWRTLSQKLGCLTIATLQAAAERELLSQKVLGSLAHIVVVSQDVREALVNHTSIKRKDMTLVPSGVPYLHEDELQLVLNRKRTSTPVIAMVGPLTSRNGLICFLDACKELVEEKCDARFLIIGTGPESAYLRARLSKDKLTRWVIPVEEMYAYDDLYSAIDVVVSTNDSLDAAYFAMEAMGRGIPAVVSASGSHLEMVEDGVSGLVFEADNGLSLARMLKLLVDDRAKRKELGKAGWNTIRESFGSASMGRAIEKLYFNLVDMKKTR